MGLGREIEGEPRPPLSGLRVLDLGDEATVLATRLLGDLGAEVVRVEDIRGDGIRRRGPFVHRRPGLERSLVHVLYNGGKRSLALDFERPDAADVLERLARQSAVVIGPLERPAAVAELLRRPLATSVVETVFRRAEPGAVATDLIGAAAGGLLYLNGFEEDPPNHPAGQQAYKQTSLAVAFAAMTLVLQARRTGPGRAVVSMQEAVSWTTLQTANENFFHWHGLVAARRGLANLGGQTVFETADGKWVSFYLHPPYWPNYCAWVKEALGLDLFEAPEWEDRAYRAEHFPEVAAVTAQLCLLLPRDAMVAESQRRSLLVVPVQSAADIAKDPHLRDRGFFEAVAFPQLGETLELARPPFLSTTYRSPARRAPALGEHSREVLAEAEFEPAEIEAIVSAHPREVAK